MPQPPRSGRAPRRKRRCAFRAANRESLRDRHACSCPPHSPACLGAVRFKLFERVDCFDEHAAHVPKMRGRWRPGPAKPPRRGCGQGSQLARRARTERPDKAIEWCVWRPVRAVRRVARQAAAGYLLDVQVWFEPGPACQREPGFRLWSSRLAPLAEESVNQREAPDRSGPAWPSSARRRGAVGTRNARPMQIAGKSPRAIAAYAPFLEESEKLLKFFDADRRPLENWVGIVGHGPESFPGHVDNILSLLFPR